MASRGVLKPKPMFFQNLVPPFPGRFPLPDFLELIKYRNKEQCIYKNQLHVWKHNEYSEIDDLRKTLGCFRKAFSVWKCKESAWDSINLKESHLEWKTIKLTCSAMTAVLFPNVERGRWTGTDSLLMQCIYAFPTDTSRWICLA